MVVGGGVGGGRVERLKAEAGLNRGKQLQKPKIYYSMTTFSLSFRTSLRRPSIRICDCFLTTEYGEKKEKRTMPLWA